MPTCRSSPKAALATPIRSIVPCRRARVRARPVRHLVAQRHADRVRAERVGRQLRVQRIVDPLAAAVPADVDLVLEARIVRHGEAQIPELLADKLERKGPRGSDMKCRSTTLSACPSQTNVAEPGSISGKALSFSRPARWPLVAPVSASRSTSGCRLSRSEPELAGQARRALAPVLARRGPHFSLAHLQRLAHLVAPVAAAAAPAPCKTPSYSAGPSPFPVTEDCRRRPSSSVNACCRTGSIYRNRSRERALSG